MSGTPHIKELLFVYPFFAHSDAVNRRAYELSHLLTEEVKSPPALVGASLRRDGDTMTLRLLIDYRYRTCEARVLSATSDGSLPIHAFTADFDHSLAFLAIDQNIFMRWGSALAVPTIGFLRWLKRLVQITTPYFFCPAIHDLPGNTTSYWIARPEEMLNGTLGLYEIHAQSTVMLPSGLVLGVRGSDIEYTSAKQVLTTPYPDWRRLALPRSATPPSALALLPDGRSILAQYGPRVRKIDLSKLDDPGVDAVSTSPDRRLILGAYSHGVSMAHHDLENGCRRVTTVPLHQPTA